MTQTQSTAQRIYRNSECRYCDRYAQACGRAHTAETASDWGRDWRGEYTADTTACQDCGGALVQAFATTANYLRCRRCGHVFPTREA